MVEPGPTLSGHGPPEGVISGIPGQGYADLDTNAFYVKLRGTQAVGWIQNGVAWGGGGGGGGGSSSKQMFSGTGSPVGVISPTTSEALYFQTDTGQWWAFFSGVWH